MTIPPEHAKRHAYHSTHLENLPGILEHGFLSCNEQERLGLTHHSIALGKIQARRAEMEVTCGPGGVVHDYVPLYFTKLSPMLLAQVRAKNVDQMLLVHFAYRIDLLDRSDVVFTDGAANRKVAPTFYSDPVRLDQLMWTAIDTLKWGSKIDGIDCKHERMAEVLVHGRLDPTDADYLVVWNKAVKTEVKKIYKAAGLTPPPIRYSDYGDVHTFTHFDKKLPDDMLNHSIAAGPWWTKRVYEKAVEEVLAGPTEDTEPTFGSLDEMLDSLREDGLAALPETAELVGLESENDVHKHDVGTHTEKVVEELLSSPEYAELQPDQQVLVELAAYLHDIGKGPKSRWTKRGGKQTVDAAHPLRSTEMLVRILTEEVPPQDESVVRRVCKLVCYHDLVGDIVGKGRNREQLAEIIEDVEDLDMLIALGKADMSSVANKWAHDGHREIPGLREWAIAELEG